MNRATLQRLLNERQEGGAVREGSDDLSRGVQDFIKRLRHNARRLRQEGELMFGSAARNEEYADLLQAALDAPEGDA